MVVRVLFFGLTAKIVNKREMEVSLSSELTAGGVLEKIRHDVPALGTQNLNISLNQQFATGEEILRDGDELAIFTAVSGG